MQASTTRYQTGPVQACVKEGGRWREGHPITVIRLQRFTLRESQLGSYDKNKAHGSHKSTGLPLCQTIYIPLGLQELVG